MTIAAIVNCTYNWCSVVSPLDNNDKDDWYQYNCYTNAIISLIASFVILIDDI